MIFQKPDLVHNKKQPLKNLNEVVKNLDHQFIDDQHLKLGQIQNIDCDLKKSDIENQTSQKKLNRNIFEKRDAVECHDIIELSQQMENRIKSQYGQEADTCSKITSIQGGEDPLFGSKSKIKNFQLCNISNQLLNNQVISSENIKQVQYNLDSFNEQQTLSNGLSQVSDRKENFFTDMLLYQHQQSLVAPLINQSHFLAPVSTQQNTHVQLPTHTFNSQANDKDEEDIVILINLEDDVADCEIAYNQKTQHKCASQHQKKQSEKHQQANEYIQSIYKPILNRKQSPASLASFQQRLFNQETIHIYDQQPLQQPNIVIMDQSQSSNKKIKMGAANGSTFSMDEEIKEEIKVDLVSNESDEELNVYSRHSSIIMLQSARGGSGAAYMNLQKTGDNDKINSVQVLKNANYLKNIVKEAEICDDSAAQNRSVNSSSKYKQSLNSKSSKKSRAHHCVKFSYFAASSLSDDRWLCPICLDIFEDAVETPCCHNLFCEGCISLTTVCPLCKLDINGQLRPNIPIRRLVHELSINCPNEDCKKVLKIGDIDKHLGLCDYTPVVCPNSPSCKKVLRKNVKDHAENECPFRVVACILECGLSMPINDMDDHIRDRCLKFEIQCKNNCGASIQRGKMQAHIGQTCPLEIVECPNKGESLFEEGCNIRLKRREMDLHKSSCAFRRTQCQNSGCQAIIIYKDFQTHDDRCLCKIVECDNKCGCKIQRQNLEKHKELCEFQLVKCPYYNLGCKIEILRKDYKNHLLEESFNHSIIFIEGQKKKNGEIDELKNEIVNLRKDYDVEIKTMFLELNRVKNQIQNLKTHTKLDDGLYQQEQQHILEQSSAGGNFDGQKNNLKQNQTDRNNVFLRQLSKAPFYPQHDFQPNRNEFTISNLIKNQRLKPMQPVSGLGNNRLNHYQKEIRNQKIFGNPHIQRPLTSDLKAQKFQTGENSTNQPLNQNRFRVAQNGGQNGPRGGILENNFVAINSLSNHTNNGSILSGSASGVLMCSRGEISQPRESFGRTFHHNQSQMSSQSNNND